MAPYHHFILIPHGSVVSTGTYLLTPPPGLAAGRDAENSNSCMVHLIFFLFTGVYIFFFLLSSALPGTIELLAIDIALAPQKYTNSFTLGNLRPPSYKKGTQQSKMSKKGKEKHFRDLLLFFALVRSTAGCYSSLSPGHLSLSISRKLLNLCTSRDI